MRGLTVLLKKKRDPKFIDEMIRKLFFIKETFFIKEKIPQLRNLCVILYLGFIPEYFLIRLSPCDTSMSTSLKKFYNEIEIYNILIANLKKCHFYGSDLLVFLSEAVHYIKYASEEL